MQKVTANRVRYDALNRNFSGLMELYELNYLNLRRLIPDMERVGKQAVSVVENGLNLHFSLIERSKYTVTFSLSYRFSESGAEYSVPDLRIRLYMDARVAEVLSGYLNHRYLHHNRNPYWFSEPDLEFGLVANRWRLNRFLFKWLKYCLKQGHWFGPVYTAGDVEHRFSALFNGGLFSRDRNMP